MANTAKWVGGTGSLTSPANLLTTELNSLGSTAGVISSVTNSGIYDNQTNLDLYGDLILHLASLSPTAGAHLDLYILVSTDGGSSFPTGSAAILPNQPDQLWRTIMLDTTAATAQDIVIRKVDLPPQKFKVYLVNTSGVALNASGNYVKIETYNYNLNA